MTEKDDTDDQQAPQPTELSDQEIEQAAGGKAAFGKPATIYDQPGTKLE